jgi:predicted DsbA family dithiol-disulfide isomerase
MHIDIVSDVICPWCFIGKRRLERALGQRPELEVSMTWRAFQLNPDMPSAGMERQAYIAAKFGSSAQASRVYAAVAEAGRSEGIDFAFDRIRRTPNTTAAHRLIRYATARGRQEDVVEGLFQGYFLEGRDIGDLETLSDIAAEGGFERKDVAAYLTGSFGREEMLAEERSARRLGINAVPCFIVDGGYAISGAQEPEFFLPLFDLAQNKAVPAPVD